MKRYVILAVAFILLPCFAVGAAPRFEDVLPEDTLFLVTIRDIPALGEKLKGYSLYDLWQEPSVQRFLEKPFHRLEEEIQKAEGEAGVTLKELWSLLQGQAALAVSADPASPAPEVVLLVDVGDQGEEAARVFGKLLDRLLEREGFPFEVSKTEEEYEGATLIKIHVEGQEGAVTSTPVVAYGVAGDVFVLGRPEGAVKRTIGFLANAPQRALSASASYRETLRKVSQDSDVVAYANIGQILSVIEQKAQGTPAPAMISALGLHGLDAACMGIEFDGEYATSRLFIGMSGVPQGLLALLTPKPGPLHSGAEAPADAAGFMSMRFDGTAVWEEVEKTLAAVSPAALEALQAQMRRISELIGEPFDIRDDVASVLGPRVGFYSRFEKPYDMRTSQQMVILVDITSKAAFEQAVGKLRKAFPPMFAMMQPREYLGYEMYAFGPPQASGTAPPPAGMPAPAYAVTENQLIISNQAAAVEAHLRRLGKGERSLKDRPDFQAGLDSLPAEGRVMIAFQNPTHQVEVMLTALAEGQFDPILNLMKSDPDVAEVLDLFDFSLVPPAADVTKHLTATVSSIAVGPDGILVVSRSPARGAESGAAD